MSITKNNYGSTVLHYDDADGTRRRRVFWVSSSGGYVRECVGTDQARDPQVCDELARRGYTLAVTDSANLAAVIRREYYAMQRRIKQEAI